MRFFNTACAREDYCMRIVFLSYLHGFGGAEKQNVMLANAMAERGHDVTLISICIDNNCYELDKSVKYIFLPDRGKGILRFLTRYQDIKRVNLWLFFMFFIHLL